MENSKKKAEDKRDKRQRKKRKKKKKVLEFFFSKFRDKIVFYDEIGKF